MPAPTAVTININGVEFTDEGFLANPDVWTRDIATTLAQSLGLPQLTDGHWNIINFARNEYLSTKVSPNIRRLTVGAKVSTKDIYVLFPKAPGKAVAKIAGIPKPAGCI